MTSIIPLPRFMLSEYVSSLTGGFFICTSPFALLHFQIKPDLLPFGVCALDIESEDAMPLINSVLRDARDWLKDETTIKAVQEYPAKGMGDEANNDGSILVPPFMFVELSGEKAFVVSKTPFALFHINASDSAGTGADTFSPFLYSCSEEVAQHVGDDIINGWLKDRDAKHSFMKMVWNVLNG